MGSNLPMYRRLFTWVVCAGLMASVASAQETIHFEGDVPDGSDRFFFLEFEVPEGTAEIEVMHAHVPAQTENILDWGVDDPNGSRGWGGGNRENAIIGIEAASRSYNPGLMPAGTWRVVVGKAKIVPDQPAGYSVDVILRTTPTLAPQPREPYQDPGSLKTESRWYAGDFHVHTRESGDGRATLTIDEALNFAEGQGLDFVMLSEHNTNSGFTLYADAQARHPDILIFPGQEYTTYGGHAGALGALDNVTFTLGNDGYTIADAITAFHEQGALFSLNHPSHPLPECIGCAWKLEVDPTTIDGVEVRTAVIRADGFWEDLCEDGSHASALAGSDDHKGGRDLGAFDTPIGTPTTLVYAADLSVDAIMEGVRSGRTVVKVGGPNGPMLETELSGERVGDTVFADTATLSAVVTGGEGMRLRIIENGGKTRGGTETLVPITEDPFTHEVTVEAPPDGENRYRHEVLDGASVVTLGSYVWLQKGALGPDGGVPDAGADPGSGSGCGIRVGSPPSDNALLFSLLFLCGWWLFRRRATRPS